MTHAACSRTLFACGIFLAAFLLPLPIFAADSSRTFTLQQCVDAALASGDQAAILTHNLGITRSQYDQSVSANSLGLKGTIGYGLSADTGNAALLSAYSTETGVATTPGVIPQALEAGLALSGPMTSVSLGGSYYLPLVGSFSDTSLVTMNVSQTIWDGYPGGTQKATVEKSLLSLRAKQLTTDSDRASFVYDVKQAYLTLLSSQRTIAAKRDILAKQESSLAQMEVSFKLQHATAVDLQTAQINVKSAEIDLRTEQNMLREARISLANLMSIPADTDFAVEEIEDSPTLTISREEAVSKGLEQRYELKTIALSVTSTAIDLALIQGQKTPTVSVGGTTYLMFGPTVQTNAVAMSATLSVSMPILDAGSAQHKEEENRYQRALYAREESQTRRSITLEIEKAYDSLKTKIEKLDLARLQAENAEAYYLVEKTGNQYGTVTNHDVMAASVDAANAQVSYAQARSDVLLAVLALQNAMSN
ncbi:MAG: TolC family protein [Spirochaetia bacterium]